LISGNSELIQLIVQSIKNDLASRNPVHVSLALQCIANIGSKDMAEAFGGDIPKLLVSGDTLDVVKQSAALCLLKLFKTHVAFRGWAANVRLAPRRIVAPAQVAMSMGRR